MQQDPWAAFPTAEPAQGPPTLTRITPPAPPPPPPAQTPLQAENDRLRNRQLTNEIREQENPRPPRLTAVQLSELEDRATALNGFEQGLNDLEELYRNTLEGSRGSLLGMGGDRNLAGNLHSMIRPDNARFESAGRRLLGYIAQSMGMTGQEMNTPGEMEMRFGPYLPRANETDEQIQDKLTSLRQMLNSQRGFVQRQLEGRQPATPDLPTRAELTPSPTREGGMDTSNAPPAVNTTPRTEISETGGGTFATDRDRAYAEALQAAFDAGAGIEQITDIAERLGYEGLNLEDLRAAIRYRDAGNRFTPNQVPGQPARIAVPETGVREPSSRGAAAATPGGAYTMHAGNAVLAGTMPLIAGATGRDSDEIRGALDASRDANPISALAGDMSGAALAYGAGGAIASRVGGALATTAPRTSRFLSAPSETLTLSPRAVSGDLAYGTLQGAGESGDPLSGAAESIIGGAAGRAIPRAAGSVVSPTGGSLGSVYREGGRPTLGQRFRGTGFVGDTINFVEEASQSIPLGGRIVRNAREGARDQWERGAWNMTLRNVVDDAGNPMTLPEGTNLGPQAMRYAREAFDNAYDRIRSNLSFQADADWTNDLATIRGDADLLSPQTRRRFNRALSDVERRIANAGGALSGDDFKSMASELSTEIRRLRRMREPSQGQRELLTTLEDLDSALHQGARRHSAPEVIEALDRTDRGYAMLTRIENAARRRPLEVGRFTPSDVLQVEAKEGGVRGRRYSAGEGLFTDYAQQGRQLEDVMPSSGSSERITTMLAPLAGPGAAAVGGVAAYNLGADPYMIGGVASIPLAYNFPGFGNAVRSAMAPRPGSAAAADIIRRRSRLTGGLGSALAAYGTQPEE